MRITVTLDDDVARAVRALRRERGLGLSAAINVLARRGAESRVPAGVRFSQTVSSMGVPRLPLDRIGVALDTVEGEVRS